MNIPSIPSLLGHAAPVIASAQIMLLLGWLAVLAIMVHGYWINPDYQVPGFVALFIGCLLGVHLPLAVAPVVGKGEGG